MQMNIAIMEGDGIGPEVMRGTYPVLEAAAKRFGIGLGLEHADGGDRVKSATGAALPARSLEIISSSDACLKAPVGHCAAEVIVKLRQVLDLYANVRPAKNLPGIASVGQNMDLVVVRENTEDLYRGAEFEFDGGAIALRLITAKATSRVAEYAAKLAAGRNRGKRVTCVHKSNVLKVTDGLFSKTCRETVAGFEGIHYDEMLVDAAAMNLVRSPSSFDVIVTSNLYGDILSDEAAQIAGGLGFAPSANIGRDHAIFEPVHGSAFDIAGQDAANPVALILSAAMMFRHLAMKRGADECLLAAEAIEKSVSRLLSEGVRTPDAGGSCTTSQFGKAVANAVTDARAPR